MAVIGQAEILLTANTASFTTEMDRARSVSQRTARQIERDQQQQASARLQIERQYASEHRRIEMSLTDEVERIRAARFNSADEQRYIAQARANAQQQVDLIAQQERATTGFADKAKAAYGYIAIAVGVAGAAIGALVRNQIEMTDELTKTAYIANTTVENIQKYAVAAKGMGIETDKLGDIFKDTQDKVGDFLTTGGGEMADFFENIAPQVKVTADQFRNLSGPDALQLYFDSLQKANLSQAEMIFYMESVADEASALIPYLKDGGKGFDLWATAAENAGAMMDEKTIRATQELKTSTELLNLSVQGAKNQIAQAFMPILRDLAGELVKDAQFKNQAAAAGQAMAQGFKIIAMAGVGVIAIMSSIGKAIGGVLAAFAQFGRVAEGVDLTSPFAAFQIAKNVLWDIPTSQLTILKDTVVDVRDTLVGYGGLMTKINNLGNGATASPLVGQLTNLTAQSEKLRNATGKTGKALKEETEAKKVNAKETEHLAKANKALADSGKYAPIPVNSKVLAHASQYNYADLEKRYGLPEGLLSAVSMQESRGNPNATSPVGAKGEFQFMPGTAARFGIAGQERNTAAAAVAAAKYLSQHLRMFGDLDKAIAAYNAGEGNVQKYGGIPPFKETKGYVKNVRGYLSFMNGGKAIDGGYDVSGALANDAQQAERERQEAERQAERERQEAERQAKEQYDLQMKYVTEFADEKTKLYLEHTAKETEIGKINDAALREQLLKTEATRHQNKVSLLELEKDKQIQKATEWQQTDAERIRATAELERREVGLTLNISKELRTAQIDAITAKEQQALRDISDAYQTELDDMTAYNRSESQRLRDDYQNNLRGIDSNSKYSETQKSDLRNALAGKFNSDLSIIRKPAADAFNSLNAEMSGTSELQNLQNQLNQRLEIIKKAKAEEVATVEQAEAAKARIERQYQISRYDMMMSSGQQILGSVTSSLKATLGEHNRAYRVMFAIEKGVNIARSLMAINTGIAMAAANPFPMNLGAMVSVAAATASIVSDLMAIKNPVGQAHDGIMEVPKSGTWNLEKGERVLPKHTAQNLDNTLNNVKGGKAVNVIIHNHTGEPVKQTTDSNGDIRVIVGEELRKQLPQHVNDPYSDFNKSLKSNYKLERRF